MKEFKQQKLDEIKLITELSRSYKIPPHGLQKDEILNFFDKLPKSKKLFSPSKDNLKSLVNYFFQSKDIEKLTLDKFLDLSIPAPYIISKLIDFGYQDNPPFSVINFCKELE